MDPNFNLLLDEMKLMKNSQENRIGAVEASMRNQTGTVEHSIGVMEHSIMDRFGLLEDAS